MSGGKSGGAGTTYDYYGTIACGLCVGPVDDLISIIMDGQEVWPQGTPWPGIGNPVTAGTLYVFDAQTWICSTSHTASAANAPGGTDPTPGWTEYTLPRPTGPGAAAYTDLTITTSDGTTYGTLRFYWGTAGQTVDYYLQSANNDGGVSGNLGHGDQHPNYAGLCYIVLIDFLFGQEVQSCPNFEIVVRKAPTQSTVTGNPALITDGQANLAAVVADILTDENCIGLNPSLLDPASFQAAANYLDGNQTAVNASVLVDTSETLRSVLEKITGMIDGYVRFNPSTALIEMGVYRHGVTPSSYTTCTTLTEDDLTAAPKFKSTSWQGTYSRATVRYNSRQLNYQQTSLHADDPRAWTILKSVREINLDRPYIARDAQALIHGRETLRQMGHAQLTAEISVRREIARPIRAGDFVFLDVDIEPNATTFQQFFRVTKVTIPMTGPFKVELLADNTLAPVPWNGPTAPTVPNNQIVPPVTSFRIMDAPTILSGEQGAVIVLAERPSNLVIGCQVYFDTDPAGTFTSLGTFQGFAARAALNTAVAATDGTLDVLVDTTQVDANLFTNSYSANQAANDTLLAFLVSVVPTGSTNAGQIANDSGGYQLVEICSVSTIALVSSSGPTNRYTLAVLRGRQNTSALAFTTANTEVWLIPRASIVGFNDTLFGTLRANELAGLTPDEAQFRLSPYTFVAQLPLSSCASEPFLFPPQSPSAPALSLTAPASYALTVAAGAFPYSLPVAGTWTTPDGNLVEIQVLLRASTDTADRVCLDSKFPPQGSQAFSLNVQVEQAGSYTIKLIARDANNFITENDLALTVTGSGARCATPTLTLADGTVVPTFDTGTADFSGVNFDWSFYPAYTPYYAPPNFDGPAIPYGTLEFACTTPGATIEFYADTYVGSQGQALTPPAQNPNNRVAYPAYKPLAIAGRSGGLLYIFFQASRSGLAVSNIQGAIIAVGVAGP